MSAARETGNQAADADRATVQDPVIGRRLRELTGAVTPLPPPPAGFEYVLRRAHHRRRRRALFTVLASALVGALTAAAVVTAQSRTGATVITTAGCDTVPGAPAAWTGTGPAGAAPGGFGVGEQFMERRYEMAIGGLLTAAALTVGIVAGCSGGNSGSSSPSTSGQLAGGTQNPAVSDSVSAMAGAASAKPSAGSTLPRCHTTGLTLTASVVANSAGGAGHELLNIRLTNTSGHACTVYGYPGMRLEDQNQNHQATNVVRDASAAPRLVPLADGAAAATTAQFDFDVAVGTEPQTGPCETASVYLQVTPPDETTQLQATIGGGPIAVCEHGRLNVLPFVSGSAGR